jgi:2OG-Fe(II) oxygenase superfamily
VEARRVMEEVMFTIGKTATVVTAEVDASRARFGVQRALLARPGVAPELLSAIDALAARSRFVPQPVVELGHRHVEQPEIAGTAVKLALMRPTFLRWVEAVTGCGAIDRIDGRLVETRPGGEDQLDWHRDTIIDTALGITIHLGDQAYDGGAFELRDVDTSDMRFRHAGAQRGDVLLFDVDHRYEHRVMPVTSGAARRVFTGWFIRAHAP